jgi:hypothetical protein
MANGKGKERANDGEHVVGPHPAASQHPPSDPDALSDGHPSTTDDSPPEPSQILPLLQCPACSPVGTLSFPITLHCGHTICSQHVLAPHSSSSPSSSSSSAEPAVPPKTIPMLPSCPLPTCTSSAAWAPSSSSDPGIPSTSRVAYFPAPSSGGPPIPKSIPHISAPRLDVTVSKIVSLVGRAQGWVEEERMGNLGMGLGQENINRFVAVSPGSDSDTDHSGSEADDDEIDQLRPLTSLPTRPIPSRPSTRSNLGPPSPSRPPTLRLRQSSHSTVRPRKRRRKHLSAHDLPTYTQGDPNAPSTNASARFEKELFSELTCEICFLLFYQPVTTPCQHVSSTPSTTCRPSPYFLFRLFVSNVYTDHLTIAAFALCAVRTYQGSCTSKATLVTKLFFQSVRPLTSLALHRSMLVAVLKAFPSVYTSRGEAIEAEERNDRLDTPIFVCQLSFPGMPTLLHIFEPR